jgi:pimeloyl-ACP methyl ester carboxylesterase
VGCFGASTGAAAALIAAAERPDRVRAVVSRGGRPDLAGDALRRVTAPTLLIVGGNDAEVLRLNRQALKTLPGEARLEVVPGATHLFEEPGALARVAALARDWFVRHLVGR